MEKTQLKKRIVGAIVLVALAVIFIPMILTGSGDNGPIWGSNIPDKPRVLEQLAERPMADMPPAPPAPETTRDLVDQPAARPATPAPVIPAVPETAQTPKPEAVPVPESKPAAAPAWAVQLGSFSQQANALALRDKLRKKKYTAFVESITTGQTTSYRVRVGPYVRRADAEAQVASISRELKIKGVVLPHP